MDLPILLLSFACRLCYKHFLVHSFLSISLRATKLSTALTSYLNQIPPTCICKYLLQWFDWFAERNGYWTTCSCRFVLALCLLIQQHVAAPLNFVCYVCAKYVFWKFLKCFVVNPQSIFMCLQLWILDNRHKKCNSKVTLYMTRQYM